MTTTTDHSFRPALLADGSPTLVCRQCGKWFDDEAHTPAPPVAPVGARPAHEGRPRPGTVTNRDHNPRTGAVAADYPLAAICDTCGNLITCADGTADWWHPTGMCREAFLDPDTDDVHVCLLYRMHVIDPAGPDEHRDGTLAWVCSDTGATSWLSSEPVG